MRLQLLFFIIFSTVASVHLPAGRHGSGLPDDSPVKWAFEVSRDVDSGYKFTAKATIPEGWHIYSQFLQEGGPIATSICLSANTAMPVGTAIERGDKHTFYSDTYECEIAWFSGSVVFERGFVPNGSAREVQGYVEYLVCNDFTCVPGRVRFNVNYR